MDRYTPRKRGIIESRFLRNNRSIIFLVHRGFRIRIPCRVAQTGQTISRLL